MSSTVSPAARDWEHDSYSLFFYGTLLHPAVLRRVIGHDGNELKHQTAVLFVRPFYRYNPLPGVNRSQGYTRHHVKKEDYPAILSWDQAQSLYPSSEAQPQEEERFVRGALVTGLNGVDVELLDVFEGDVSSAPAKRPRSSLITAFLRNISETS